MLVKQQEGRIKTDMETMMSDLEWIKSEIEDIIRRGEVGSGRGIQEAH